ncbi:kinase-like domain-containing protein [Chlamydoabsidia padenii]|nr:kinase-like domain-containing protein [Chlamydoabsidia padenii]
METEHNLCLILEYAQGMELFDFVQQMHQRLHSKNEKVNEGLIKKIFLQLVLVVKWMHEHNIVHRDLKLENILIHMDEQHQGEPILKVTDFGLARVIDPDSPILTTRCGSEEYAAPEIVQSKGYDGRQTDTWALGVILYALLVGYLPFRYDATKGERVTQMFYRIVRAQVKWPKTWDQHHHIAITPQAKEVVERILVRQPEQRIHLDDIDGLPWFQQQ